ncbi:MAG: pseudouridine synthase [Rickettsiales bacterium]
MPPRAKPLKNESPEKGERIAKYMARAGIASRRGAEAMIAAGHVTVNGKKITSPALNINEGDVIAVDGNVILAEDDARLFLYHKPAGLITTHKDPEGRPTVFDALPKGMPRVVSVGRLDFSSEGLLLLTTSGELAHKLEDPKLGWKRKYRVRAYGHLTEEQMNRIRSGITVDGIRYRPAELRFESRKGKNAWYVMTITEGKNREIRKIFEHFDCKVSRLIRVGFGAFQLGSMQPGEVKEISAKALREQIGL